jgi:hypothetical protein
VDRQLTRRSFCVALGATALSLALPLRQAGAGRSWCRQDPEFFVFLQTRPSLGAPVNVYVSTEEGVTVPTTGPIKLRLSVPPKIGARLVSQDLGLGHGYDVSIVQSSKLKFSNNRVDFKTEVYVPASSSQYAILAEFIPNGIVELADAVEGTTNRWITVKTRIRF